MSARLAPLWLMLSACSLAFPMSDFDRGGGGGAAASGGAPSGGAATGGGGALEGGGGALPQACGDNPPVSEIVDTFDAGIGSSLALFGPCVAVSGGEVVATPQPAGDFCWVYTLGTHRLACDSFSVRVSPALTPELGAQTFIYVEDVGGAGDLNLILEGGDFQFVPPLDIANPSFDPTRDLYWRLRGGVPGPNGETTIAFDTSEDGVTWDERGGGVSPIPLTNVSVQVGAGVYQAVPNPPGEAHFDCVNAPAPCP